MKACKDKHCESWRRFRWSPSSLHRRDGWMEGGKTPHTDQTRGGGKKKTKLGGAGKQRRGEERREALLVATQSHSSRCHRAFGFPLTPTLSPFYVRRSRTQPVRRRRPEHSREDCAHHFYNRRLSRGAARGGGTYEKWPVFHWRAAVLRLWKKKCRCVCCVSHSLKTHKLPPLSRRSLRSATQELVAKFDFERLT